MDSIETSEAAEATNPPYINVKNPFGPNFSILSSFSAPLPSVTYTHTDKLFYVT